MMDFSEDKAKQIIEFLKRRFLRNLNNVFSEDSALTAKLHFTVNEDEWIEWTSLVNNRWLCAIKMCVANLDGSNNIEGQSISSCFRCRDIAAANSNPSMLNAIEFSVMSFKHLVKVVFYIAKMSDVLLGWWDVAFVKKGETPEEILIQMDLENDVQSA